MTSRIHRLSPEVANRIAAGEVVERPASVVKELVENAVDAGASQVAIEVESGGLSLIRVIDDGCGMSPEDALLAFERHATSKITSADQLESICTMGFRGEALPSVASVSRVRLVTRERGAEHAVEVTGEGTDLKGPVPLQAGFGTTVEVRDLFFNTPARLKYLRTPSTENRRIIETVSRLVLAHPGVGFSLWVDRRKVLSTPAGGSLQDAMAEVLGVDTARGMIPVSYEADGITVAGYIGAPEVARSGRDGQYTAVNGRPVTSKTVWSAVDKAYDRSVAAGRKALVVLSITLPPERVDVNVHPAKTEVRFASDGQVYSAVHRAVVAGLRTMEAAPRMMPVPQQASGPQPHATPPALERQVRLFDGAGEIAHAGAGAVCERPDSPYGAQMPAEIPRVIGQLARSYILLEGDEGLIIVDQHVAHERVLVEKYRRQWLERKPEMQLLLEPQIISVSASEMQAVIDGAPALRRMGFEVEPFGSTAVAVRGIPSTAVRIGAARALAAAVDGLTGAAPSAEELRLPGAPPGLPEEVDRVAVSLACHTAIRAGEALDRTEMEALVRALLSAEDPFRCPHGRPVVTVVPLAQIEKGFGRR